VTREVGARLASGRDGDIFDYGAGLVLRRAHDRRSLESEARVMRFVADHGYPVPVVEDVLADGSEIVMQRIDGPMMMDTMARRPWTLRAYAQVLADLHDALHSIAAPAWLPRRLDGDRVLHLDLHPMNVMLADRGPVVIDWSNACAGPAVSDTALTYVLLTCPDVPGLGAAQWLARPVRLALGGAFARRYRGPEFDDHLASMAELKTLDANMTPREIAACRKLAERVRR
jgi:aminoglycoside phosphotransferase (APT) family kinase protein